MDVTLCMHFRPRLPQLVSVSVLNRKGVLYRNEKKTIKIEIKSLGLPCYIHNLVLTCELLDLTKRREYDKNIRDIEREQERRRGEFIITEHEIKILVRYSF